MTEQPQTPPKKGWGTKIKEALFPDDPTKRIEDAYGILKEVGGFQPLFNIRDLEQRRKELMSTLKGCKLSTRSYTVKRDVVDKVFTLFFGSGSPWYRGLDDREKSSKVADFLELYEDVRALPSFMGDLFNCAMQLLHISFTETDVTNTPAYVSQSTPIVSPYAARVNLGGSSAGRDGGESAGRHERVE